MEADKIRLDSALRAFELMMTEYITLMIAMTVSSARGRNSSLPRERDARMSIQYLLLKENGAKASGIYQLERIREALYCIL